MKVTVPVLMKDPAVVEYKDLELVREFDVGDEAFLLDGPVSKRLAVLDFDAASGALRPGVRFDGRYEIASRQSIDADDFIQASTFGGVLRTVYLFEQPDTLGRAVRWAFDGPQLLVVPRAGEWGNAFYERESRSLQFFYVTAGGRPTYACHSMDILAHETAHAVLDGVAPDLYDSLLPESLALHEAVADLSALLIAFSDRPLAERVLRQTNGSIRQPTAFTAIAPQFAAAIHPGQDGLRDLVNDRTMSTVDTTEPHALSEVLSGALYAVMVRIHEELKTHAADQGMRTSTAIVPVEVQQWQRQEPAAEAVFQAERQRAGKSETTRAASAMRALYIAARRFQRTVLRALDYLPPGEVTFADYGRAIVASDQASHPDSGEQREWLKAEFTRRGIVRSPKALEVATSYRDPAVAALDLPALVESDWLAYEFANRARRLLAIPKGIPFKVAPRLDVTKTYYHRDRAIEPKRECLFKVSWTETEANPAGSAMPSQRQVRRGTTLAIDWETRNVRAVVTTGDRDARTRKQEREARDRLVGRLLARDALPAELAGDTFAARGTARILHVTREA